MDPFVEIGEPGIPTPCIFPNVWVNEDGNMSGQSEPGRRGQSEPQNKTINRNGSEYTSGVECFFICDAGYLAWGGRVFSGR